MTKNLVHKIKELSIVKIIEQYLTLNKRGANYLAICPFHNDTKPSLTVNENKNVFKCFACGVSGNGITFVQKKDNLTYHQALIKIAKLFNFSEDEINSFSHINDKDFKNEKLYQLNRRYLDLCQSFLDEEFHKRTDVYNYLMSRNIDKNTIDKFGIGYNPNNIKELYEFLTNESNRFENIDKDDIYTRQELIDANLAFINSKGDIYDTFQGRIVFSIKDEKGNIVGFSGRNLTSEEPKYLNSSNTNIFKKNEILYNWSDIKYDESLSNKLYIVEGFMDVIALTKVGIDNVVATMGTALSQNHIKLLKQSNIQNIILGFDNDDAGKKATKINGELLSKYFKVFVINTDNIRFKDFDEILNKTDESTLINVVKNEIDFSIFLLNYLLKENTISTLSEKQTFFDNAIKIIEKYGDVKLKNEYINLINKITQYDFDFLNEKINSIFKDRNKSWPNKTKNEIINNKTNKEILAQREVIYFNIYEKMIIKQIMACLVNSQAVEIIKNKYMFCGITKLNDNFDYLYNLFETSINLLCDFYLNHPNKKSINAQDKHELISFLERYNDCFNIDKYVKLFNFCIETNENKINSYQYSKNNIIESIKLCNINDLEFRKLLILKTSNNENFDENKYKKYNEMIAKIKAIKM